MADQVSLSPDYLALSAEIVSAYVSKNSVQPADLPSLIGSVHYALYGLGQPAPQTKEKLKPAVPIKKSVTPDALISLEDGKPYKSLKRHLTKLGLTPEQYRVKWSLPSDYPMVAASYAARRSELARSMGLGQKRKGAAKTAATSQKVTGSAPKKRGGKKTA